MKNGLYELILAPKDYPGRKYRSKYAYEHIIIWWQHTGQLPLEGHEIHHINGDHRDNRIENLMSLLTEEHQKIHSIVRRKKALVRCTCFTCNKEFERRGNSVRFALKTYGRIFCCRSCQVINQQKELRKKVA